MQPSFYYNSTLNVKRFYRDKLPLASYTTPPLLCDNTTSVDGDIKKVAHGEEDHRDIVGEDRRMDEKGVQVIGGQQGSDDRPTGNGGQQESGGIMLQWDPGDMGNGVRALRTNTEPHIRKEEQSIETQGVGKVRKENGG